MFDHESPKVSMRVLHKPFPSQNHWLVEIHNKYPAKKIKGNPTKNLCNILRKQLSDGPISLFWPVDKAHKNQIYLVQNCCNFYLFGVL